MSCMAGDDLVVVSTRSGAVHVLDPSGAHLLRVAVDWTTVDDLVDSLTPTPNDGRQVRAEIEAALDEMTRLKLMDRL